MDSDTANAGFCLSSDHLGNDTHAHGPLTTSLSADPSTGLPNGLPSDLSATGVYFSLGPNAVAGDLDTQACAETREQFESGDMATSLSLDSSFDDAFHAGESGFPADWTRTFDQPRFIPPMSADMVYTTSMDSRFANDCLHPNHVVDSYWHNSPRDIELSMNFPWSPANVALNESAASSVSQGSSFPRPEGSPESTLGLEDMVSPDLLAEMSPSGLDGHAILPTLPNGYHERGEPERSVGLQCLSTFASDAILSTMRPTQETISRLPLSGMWNQSEDYPATLSTKSDFPTFRRSSSDGDAGLARSHLFYQMDPQDDGYHCPLENDGCSFNPERLKCNYE